MGSVYSPGDTLIQKRIAEIAQSLPHKSIRFAAEEFIQSELTKFYEKGGEVEISGSSIRNYAEHHSVNRPLSWPIMEKVCKRFESLGWKIVRQPEPDKNPAYRLVFSKNPNFRVVSLRNQRDLSPAAMLTDQLRNRKVKYHKDEDILIEYIWENLVSSNDDSAVVIIDGMRRYLQHFPYRSPDVKIDESVFEKAVTNFKESGWIVSEIMGGHGSYVYAYHFEIDKELE